MNAQITSHAISGRAANRVSVRGQPTPCSKLLWQSRMTFLLALPCSPRCSLICLAILPISRLCLLLASPSLSPIPVLLSFPARASPSSAGALRQFGPDGGALHENTTASCTTLC